MSLVTWIEGTRDGVGRSGTHYSILYRAMPASDEPFNCRIAIDGEEVCAVDSLEAAMGRVEHLEALRCFVFGLAAELSAGQLGQADDVAAEMATAAEQSLGRPGLTGDERAAIEESAAALQSIRHRIQTVQSSRSRGIDGSAAVH